MTEQEVLKLVRKLVEAEWRCQAYRSSSGEANAQLWGEAMAEFNAIVEALVEAGQRMSSEEPGPA